MRILILESNLLWSTKLKNAVISLGHSPTVSVVPPDGLFDLAIVNLGDQGVDWPERVLALQARGMKVVGHAGHKEKELHDIGRAAGCDRLVTNSELAHKLDRVLANVFKVRTRVAITGGIAEGKSTILAYLKEAGHEVASADAIAKEVYAGDEVQRWLTDQLGSPASKEEVRARLADDPAFRRRLNAMTHPLILRNLAQHPAQFTEVPLLIETCTHVSFDKIWVVTCGVAEQHKRLSARLNSAAFAEELLRTQLPTRAKIPFADVIVRTNQDEETVRRIVFAAAAQI